jgi:hypothetical protein
MNAAISIGNVPDSRIASGNRAKKTNVSATSGLRPVRSAILPIGNLVGGT